MLGTIGDSDLHDEGARLLLEAAAHQVIGDVELEGILAVRIGLSFYAEDLVELHIEGVADEQDAALIHRLAEEVAGVHGTGHVLSGEVERLVGCGLDLEFGEDVVFDDDRGLRGGIAQRGLDLIIPDVDLVG